MSAHIKSMPSAAKMPAFSQFCDWSASTKASPKNKTNTATLCFIIFVFYHAKTANQQQGCNIITHTIGDTSSALNLSLYSVLR